jgi:hypothetical protein
VKLILHLKKKHALECIIYLSRLKSSPNFLNKVFKFTRSKRYIILFYDFIHLLDYVAIVTRETIPQKPLIVKFILTICIVIPFKSKAIIVFIIIK